MKPLEIFLKRVYEIVDFHWNRKKANAVPIHKKSDKETTENYRLVSLLSICGKVFEGLLYDTVWFFSKNLLSSNQSGFRAGDSCINQLLSVNHELLSDFDIEIEVCGIFLDIPKAFEEVWHDRQIFKLRHNGVCGEMINTSRISLVTESKKSFQVVRFCIGLMLALRYHKDPFWDPCYPQRSISWRIFVFCSSRHWYFSKWS